MGTENKQKRLSVWALDMDAAFNNDPRYGVSFELNSTLEYELAGDLPLLDDLATDPDHITLEWEDGRIFVATLLRKISREAMADFAAGDAQRIALTDPRDISAAIQKDPVIGGLRVFYDATFDDPDGPAQDHHIAVKLIEA